MNENDNVKRYEAAAEESDWLEISYLQRNYLKEELESATADDSAGDYYVPPRRRAARAQNAQRQSPEKGKKMPLFFRVAIAVTALVVLLTGLLLIDANFNGNIFETAKTVFTWDALFGKKPAETDNTIKLTPNATITEVAPNGTITLTGGRVATSLKAGKVVAATSKTVTVEIDTDTRIVYSNLTEVLVTVGQDVERGEALGKYAGTMCINIVFEDKVVSNIVGSIDSFVWAS